VTPAGSVLIQQRLSIELSYYTRHIIKLSSLGGSFTMRPVQQVLSVLFIILGLVVFDSCTKEDSVGLYDPNEAKAADPSITGISPSGSAYAGLDTVILQGANFSANPLNIVVYFNATPAQVYSATATQISVKAPVVTMDSIGVRVGVVGAVSFSNTFQYKLISGVNSFGRLDTLENFAALTPDASGNLHASRLQKTVLGSVVTTSDGGIIKFAPAGTRTSYAPGTNGVTVPWNGLKFGPGGYLYAAKNQRAVYRFSPGGGSVATAWVAFGVGIFIYDLDFDADGNAWAGGNDTAIFKIDKNKVVTAYPFAGNVHSIRVYNSSLYFAAKTSAGEKIWRAPITSGTLGTFEVYYDFGASYPSNVPMSITFSSDGTLFIGTDASVGLVVVSPGKAVTTPFSLYSASFGTGLANLAWGNSDDLYVSTANGALLKMMVRGKTTAPYLGSAM
jgi:hypothetical protein